MLFARRVSADAESSQSESAGGNGESVKLLQNGCSGTESAALGFTSSICDRPAREPSASGEVWIAPSSRAAIWGRVEQVHQIADGRAN